MIKILKEKAEIVDFITKNEQRGGGDNSEIEKSVREILEDVKVNGDEAVSKYTKKWDCENPQYYRVPEEIINEAYEKADIDLINALKRSKENIEAFHVKQRREGYTVEQDDGIVLKQIIRPLDRVGIYVPGGTAPLISTVLMCAVPAKIAGVGEIVMVTPPQKDGTPNPEVLAAAKLCGVNQVFLCGGAQAIAALAYGTREIPGVSKIVGPGSAYVATAKKMLYGKIDIDMIAGPSEVLIIADENANPRYIAADLLSQAEHDVLASAVLITKSETLAEAVKDEIGKQLDMLQRKEIASESLRNYSGIIIEKSKEEQIKWANLIAPEHLEIMTQNPLEYENEVVNYGSLFLGEYSPEPLGDYFAGPNHVLPTNGTARFSSPLSVDDFIKKSSSILYTKEALKKAADSIILVAEREGLDAHANSIKVRCEN
ncbi:MAG: histidinol dehydrogenase [Oscillospiraceae bacterium]|nr:histidinol dehydrogenase [Oscillospiraceae bacterium]